MLWSSVVNASHKLFLVNAEAVRFGEVPRYSEVDLVLSQSESLSLQDWQRIIELHVHSEVVTWHAHLDFLGQGDVNGNISCTDEALRPVTGEERLGATTLIWL